MNSSRSIYVNYILFPVIVLYAVTLPFPAAYNSIFTLLLLAINLANVKMLPEIVKNYFSNRRNIVLLILLLGLIASVLYSEDKEAALKGTLAALPLFVLPFSLTNLPHLSVRQIEIIKKGFVYSCFIISLFYLVQTTIRIGIWDGTYKIQTGPVGYKSSYLVYNLTYHQLTPSIHAVFFSFYIAVAVLILIFSFRPKNTLSTFLISGLIFYFICYLILLTSATINFGLYSFIVAYLFFTLSFKKVSDYLLFFALLLVGTVITDYLLVVKYIGPDIGDIIYRFDSPTINRKIIWSFALVFGLAIIAIIIKLARSRYIHYGLPLFLLITGIFIIPAYWEEIAGVKLSNSQVNNLSVRANYGAESFKIIKTQPVLGVGIGDKKFDLIKRDTSLGETRYVEFGASTKPGDVFNAHNQFLDFWIAAGIIPVICLILLFIGEFVKALKYQNKPYLGLVFIFLLFCFTDKALMVQRGQALFLFFICLFEGESRRNVAASLP